VCGGEEGIKMWFLASVSMSMTGVGPFERDVRRHVRNDAAERVMEWLMVCNLLGERKARVRVFSNCTCREVL